MGGEEGISTAVTMIWDSTHKQDFHAKLLQQLCWQTLQTGLAWNYAAVTY